MMPLHDWIPGWGHWRLGQRVKGSVVGSLFALFVLLGLWHARTIWGSLLHTASKLSGAAVVYTPRDLDFLVTSLFVLTMLVLIVFYSGLSCRRRRKLEHLAQTPEGQWSIVWRQFQRNPLAVAGVVIILALYLVAFLCPFIAPYDPIDQGDRVRERLLPPSVEHLLGTDRFARDVFSRVVYGSRISLLVGFLSVGIAVTIGTLVGAMAGFYGGWIESLIMRFVDMMLSFPVLILIITVIALWREQSIWIIITVIGLMSWMGVARLVRGQFLVLKEREFFQAARALGAGDTRLIFRHLLPNSLTPIIISATLRVGNTILLEAALSYLGLGVQPPTASWGNIVYDTKGNLFTEWWMPLSAGLAIVITVVGYNLLGDGLRDALDPRLRE
jgi:peptide/nickel transport system permease protein